MKNFGLVTLLVTVLTSSGAAQSLSMRRASWVSPTTRTVTHTSPAATHGGVGVADSRGPCGPSSGNGSLDQYPGSCCPDAPNACCAGLWDSYCRDKKPCWNPHSPRRGIGGVGCGHASCGSGCDFLRTPCLTGHCGRRAAACCDGASDCDAASNGANCAVNEAESAVAPDASAAPAESPPLSPEPAPYPEVQKQEEQPVPGDAPAPPPEPQPSALRGTLPFGLNSPNPRQGFPFDSATSAKRSQLPFAR